MRFNDLIQACKDAGIWIKHKKPDVEITGEIRTDNRQVEPGDIFVCIRGFSVDGHSFASEAVAKGASLIICEQDMHLPVASLIVSSSRKAAALACKLRYENPSSSFLLVGVTGTNGKTTVTRLLFQALQKLGHKCGLIGTLGYFIGDDHYPTMHTTPDIVELNSIFCKMKESGVTHVVMEVSSHAIALNRVYGLDFDYCLFTNLSRDHLDFHKNMQEYAETKYSFFFDNPGATAIVNVEDKYGAELYDALLNKRQSCFTVSDGISDFMVQSEIFELKGCSFEIVHKNRVLDIKSRLSGSYNVRNMALLVAQLSLMGISNAMIQELCPQLLAPEGRFEPIENGKDIGVYVDYAHTPEALEKVLNAVSKMPKRRLLCLIGAGGDRDKGKRPLMLKMALRYCDAVLISDDNPRFEDPKQIIREMVADTDLWLPWWIVRDRKAAIEALLQMAVSGDVVIIFGKGHETYQEVCGTRTHFDDREIARAFLQSDTDHTKTDPDALVLPVDPLLLSIMYESNTAMSDKAYLLRYISIDSRTIKPDSLYFAIKGERFDGHDFIRNVLEEPTNMAIGSIPKGDLEAMLEVNDTLEALGQLCRKYLLMFPAFKIGLTGSTGKTTCKEILAGILSARGSVLKSEKNENNIIGLCKTILKIRPENQFAVFELGTNHFGEIAALAQICTPDCGMILNIGPSHLEFLIDEDGVFTEKSALLDRPMQHRIYPADDTRFLKYRPGGVSVGFSDAADYRIALIGNSEEGFRFKLNEVLYTIPFDVSHFAINASFAIACAKTIGIRDEMIHQALMFPPDLGMRMQKRVIGMRHVLVDCYNANPVSMLAAIEHWHAMDPDKEHIAILGDMLELGENSVQYHSMIAAVLAEMGFDYLICVGQMAEHYVPDGRATDVQVFPSAHDLIASGLLEKLPENACILLKGSHGIKLETIIPHLIQEGK